MARKVEAYESKDGTVHKNEFEADRSDAKHDLNIAAVELAAAIRPAAYGDEDQLVRDLIENAELVMAMGDAFRRRSRYA